MDLIARHFQPGRAAASRGLIVRCVARRARRQAGSTAARLVFLHRVGQREPSHRRRARTPARHQGIAPGDFVEADLELVVLPADAASYYGPDKSFQKALAGDADTWRLVHREAVGNALKSESRRGAVLNPYPLRIAVDDAPSALRSRCEAVSAMCL